MKQASKISLLFTMLLSICVATAAVRAQDEEFDIFDLDDDPLGAAAAGDASVLPAIDVLDEATTDPAASGTAAVDAEEPEVIDSLGIRLLRESNPTAPDELIRAAKIASDLDRPDLADEYLKQLASLALDDESQAKLHQNQSGNVWFQLSTSKSISDASREIVMDIIRAADRFSRSQENVEQLVTQLTNGDRGDFRAALVQLRRARESAVNPLVQAIANPDQKAQRGRLQAALIHVGKPAVPPLHASLAHPDDDVRSAIIEVLGHIKATESIPYLLGPALADEDVGVRTAANRALLRIQGRGVSTAGATSFLQDQVLRLNRGLFRGATDEVGLLIFWTWDGTSAVPFQMERADAAAIAASRLAADLYLIAPTPDHRLLDIGSRLAMEKRVGGLDRPLRRDTGGAFQFAAQAGASVLEQVLSLALERGHTDMALAAIEVLGEIGSPQLLAGSATGRPLARALEHKSARVRFAAAAAVMQLDPRQSYPGSSRFISVLTHMASSSGRDKILVGHPNAAIAQRIAGAFSQLGMQTELAHTGNSFRKKSLNSSDYQFFLISDRMDRPVASRLLHQLRGDPRTAEIPIAIMTVDETLEQARLKIREANRTLAVALPLELEAAIDLSDRLNKLARRDAVPADQRAKNADRALQWLGYLAEHSADYPFYSIAEQQQQLLAALNSLQRSAQASNALAAIGTPEAQYALWQTARQRALPEGDRKAAAEAFAKSIRRYHVMLTQRQLDERLQAISDPINREVTKVVNQVLGER